MKRKPWQNTNFWLVPYGVLSLPTQRWHSPQWTRPSHINHQWRNYPTDMPIDQSCGHFPNWDSFFSDDFRMCQVDMEKLVSTVDHFGGVIEKFICECSIYIISTSFSSLQTPSCSLIMPSKFITSSITVIGICTHNIYYRHVFKTDY